jgi:hypothetical protein
MNRKLYHYPIEDRFAESALGANQQSFRFGQFTDEQMLEKPETTMRNNDTGLNIIILHYFNPIYK